MSELPGLRRGLVHFLAGRLLSGLLGLAWLGLLVRVLPPVQYGVYFGCVSLFEVLQLASSLGVYNHAARVLPAAWQRAPRAVLRRTLLRLLGWRLGTLALAVAVLVLGWGALTRLLDWPGEAPNALLFAAFLLAAGSARLLEVAFESGLQQGWIQSASALRNIARLLAVGGQAWQGGALSAAWVIGLETMLALAFLAAAGVRMRSRIAHQPAQPVLDWSMPGGLLGFTLQGYASTLLAQVCGLDAVKLILSHTAGPQVLGVFGLANSIAETVARYMPAGLLYSYARSVLTARADRPEITGGPLPAAQGLLRANALFLALATTVLLTCGEPLLSRLAGPTSGPSAMAATTMLVLLLQVQGPRLVGSLVLQVRSNNAPILWANLATLPVPLLAVQATQAWGLPGAVATAALLELIYASVTLAAGRLSPRELAGPWRLWAFVAGAMAAAALAGVGLRRFDAREPVALLVAVLLAGALVGLLRPLRALAPADGAWLRALRPRSAAFGPLR